MNKMIKKFMDGEFVVNCVTEDQARKFIDICYGNGIKWSQRVNNNTSWWVYEEESCYCGDGCHLKYADKDWYKNMGYEIITFDKFMERYKIKFTKDMLEVGMLVECEEMGLCMVMEDSTYGLVYVSDDGYMKVADLDNNFENKNDIY